MTNAKTAAIFRRDVTRYFQAAQTTGQQLTVAAIDIDHFKQINDHYGHLVGDDVLIGVANTIARALRTDDGHHALYRTGGEEFAIVFQATPIKSVQAIVEGVWHAVQKQRFEAGEYSIHTTLSIGVAELVGTDTRFDDLYARADADLYQSKHNGRNAITINGNTLNNHTTQHVMATRTLITQNVLHVEDITRPVAQEVLLARYEYDHDRWNFPTVFVVPLLVQLNYVSELLAAGVSDEIMLHLTAAQFARNETITQMLDFQRAHPALRQWVVELDHQIELMPLAAWAPRYRRAGIRIAMINIDAQRSMGEFASRLPYLDILKMTCAGMRERFPNGIDDQHFASWQHQAGNVPLVFIITGIENSVDADYAKQVLKADYLQGYYFDRPELPRLA